MSSVRQVDNKLTKQCSLSDQIKKQIFKIWSAEYPKQSVFETYEEFDTYLSAMKNPTHYTIEDHSGKLLGWLATIDRDGGRWLVILVDHLTQKNGIGTRLLNEMKTVEEKIAAWITPHNDYFKADGSQYITPLPFYLKNGFILTDETFEKEDFGGTKIIWEKSK